jgi:hypothetical protein
MLMSEHHGDRPWFTCDICGNRHFHDELGCMSRSTDVPTVDEYLSAARALAVELRKAFDGGTKRWRLLARLEEFERVEAAAFNGGAIGVGSERRT